MDIEIMEFYLDSFAHAFNLSFDKSLGFWDWILD